MFTKKRLLALILTLVLAMSMTVPVFASSGSSDSVTYESSLKPILDKILAQISIANIVSMIGAFIAAGIGFVFLWWAIRKGISILMSAIRKGKVSS